MADGRRIFAFINGRFGPDDVVVVAVAEDGTFLASHVSSSVSWAKHDIGVTGTWQHDKYAAHYPEGFAVEWVDDVDGHADLQRALELNGAQTPADDATENAEAEASEDTHV